MPNGKKKKGHVDVAHREGGLPPLVLVFHQFLVLEQRNRDFLRLHIDDYFACHSLWVKN